MIRQPGSRYFKIFCRFDKIFFSFCVIHVGSYTCQKNTTFFRNFVFFFFFTHFLFAHIYQRVKKKQKNGRPVVVWQTSRPSGAVFCVQSQPVEHICRQGPCAGPIVEKKFPIFFLWGHAYPCFDFFVFCHIFSCFFMIFHVFSCFFNVFC